MMWGMVILPTLGPLHLMYPRYNAASVLHQIEHRRTSTVFFASYSPEGLEQGLWRDRNDLVLFELRPLVDQGHIRLVGLGENAEALQHEAELFAEYLGQLPAGEEAKRNLAEAEREVWAYLSMPRLPQELASADFVEGLRERLGRVVEIAGEGPATGFRAERMAQVARKLREHGDAPVVLVDVLDYPELLRHFPDAEGPLDLEPSEEERARALMDRAWRLDEGDEWGSLLAQLMELARPEARFLAAQIYLAAGQTNDALVLLEDLAKDDFSQPEYLPGYLLARLGQLYDLVGNRERAIRSYRGVLALSWAPAEAREIAQAGMRTPFRVEG